MLVLSRKVGEEIIVGDNIRITITKVTGNRVTLGVKAPDDVRILRGELQPVVCSFDDTEKKTSPSRIVSRALEAITGEIADTIPFAPQVVR